MAGPAPLSATLYDAAKALAPTPGRRPNQPTGVGSARLRQVKIASRDPTALTCQVYLDGDTTSPVPCGLTSATVVPVVGAWGWALQNGSDLVLVDSGAELPKASLWTTDTQTATGSAALFSFAGAGTTVEYDTDLDGVNLFTVGSMADKANSRIYCRWPGKYLFGANMPFGAGAAAGRRILDVRVNNVSFIARNEARAPDTSEAPHLTLTRQRVFAAGDFIDLRVTSTGGNSTVGVATDELGAHLWMSFAP